MERGTLFLFLLAVLSYLWLLVAPTHSATLQGISCPGTHLIWKKSVDYGEQWDNNIALNRKQLNALPLIERKFVFMHECGHYVKGKSEILADVYAFNHVNLPSNNVEHICQIIQDSTRCNYLRKMSKAIERIR